jgi:hypothetical protein
MVLFAAPEHFLTAASRTWLKASLVGLLFVSAASLAQNLPAAQTKGADAPVLKADAGPCTADFVVRDASGKGVYDAKITLQVQYGFMGLRKLDLNVGTNYEGRARIEGLPEKTKRAAEFKISQGGREKMVAYDPVGHCTAQHEVTLGDTAENKAN